MSGHVIVLAGKQFPVEPLPFKVLRRQLPAINRLAMAFVTGQLDDAAMDDLGDLLSAATGVSVEQLDTMPILASELSAAFAVVVEVAGLAERGGPGSGEALPAGATGTTSTPTSPPASVGRGKRLTA